MAFSPLFPLEDLLKNDWCYGGFIVAGVCWVFLGFQQHRFPYNHFNNQSHNHLFFYPNSETPRVQTLVITMPSIHHSVYHVMGPFSPSLLPPNLTTNYPTTKRNQSYNQIFSPQSPMSTLSLGVFYGFNNIDAKKMYLRCYL